MIEKFIAALQKLNIEATPEEIADMLWYAAQRPFPVNPIPIKSVQKSEPADKSDKSTVSSEKSANKSNKSKMSEVPPIVDEQFPKESLKLYPTGGDENKGGIPFRTPGASALPGALKLAKALRPLKRRVLSAHQVTVDIEATVHRIAQTDIWVPVQRAVSIPWLEVALVVEVSPSMRLWLQTVQELRLLLERQGAFRDVRLWQLDTSQPNEMVLSTGGSTTKRSYRELINPAVPKVIWVVTDCISSVWQTGAMNQWLKAWGRAHTVAIVQLLPQQLWLQTQARHAQLLRVTAPYSAAPNEALKRESRSPWLQKRQKNQLVGVPMPILTLEPDFMSAWVQLIANPTDSKKMPALIFKSSLETKPDRFQKPVRFEENATPETKPDRFQKPVRFEDAEKRFANFKANATPTAFELACLLAAAPLRLPIMRLVQKNLLPQSRQVHLAEFFLSGLLRRVNTDEAIDDPDEIPYDFIKDDSGFDIRGKLLDMGLVPDAIQVQRTLSDYIAERYGQPNDFQAILENPEAIDKLSGNLPFASVSAEVLRRLGGHYAKAAKLLTLPLFSFETVTVNRKGEIINRLKKQARYYTEDLGNGITLDMMYIPGGTFMMGSPETEKDRRDDEGPQHEITVEPFFMGKYPVTQAQWQAVMGNNPSRFKGGNLPVEKVSWNDAVEFCEKLSEITGKTYRLSNESEWEYSCRAGTTTPFYFGETITSDLVNYRGTSTYADEPEGVYREETTDVGSFPPNAFGLYDMHGNVWEWTGSEYEDQYKENRYLSKNHAKEDSRLSFRGGAWSIVARWMRSADRFRFGPADRGDSVGFRVARL